MRITFCNRLTSSQNDLRLLATETGHGRLAAPRVIGHLHKRTFLGVQMRITARHRAANGPASIRQLVIITPYTSSASCVLQYGVQFPSQADRHLYVLLVRPIPLKDGHPKSTTTEDIDELLRDRLRRIAIVAEPRSSIALIAGHCKCVTVAPGPLRESRSILAAALHLCNLDATSATQRRCFVYVVYDISLVQANASSWNEDRLLRSIRDTVLGIACALTSTGY